MLVTVEEHVGLGGFGAAVLELLSDAGVQVPTHCLAIPNRVVDHGDRDVICAELGLDAAGIARAVALLLAEHPSR